MLQKIVIVLIAIMVVCTVVMAERVNSPIARTRVPVMTGNEVIDAQRAVPPNGHGANPALDDPVGVRYQAGTTWYDYQHNGTAGKMVGTDDSGYVHIVWMNGLNAAQNPRHVYYNVWNPTTGLFVQQSGVQVNSSPRAGYACQVTMPSGFCFPAFHETSTGSDSAHTAAAIDFAPRTGGFAATQPAWFHSWQILWPKIAQDPDSLLHVVSTQFAVAGGDPQMIYYSRGMPVFDAQGFGENIDWQTVMGGPNELGFVDSCMTIAADVATSRHSDRVVLAWAHNRDRYVSQIDNDLWIMVSEDGGLNWGTRTNITNFVPGDPSCPSGDSLVCNNDTLRLYTDCSAFIDDQDNIHVAFSVRTWYDLLAIDPGTGEHLPGPTGWISQSGIFHWSEEFNEFSPIANEYHFQTVEGGTLVDNGGWQLNAHRPSLCEDTTNGYLYCSYQRYDSTQYSTNGFPMGDAWVTVSTNGGRVWSQAQNVTNTDGGQNTPAPGSLSERDITLSKYVSSDAQGNRYINMSYIMDHDAGGFPQVEGVATLNEVYYQRIPVDSIEARPLLNPYWPAMHVDSTGFPGRVIPLDTSLVANDLPTLRPNSFAVYQNYPNPFNPTTNIQFDLARDARVTLKVYNVMGEEVTTLLDNKSLAAGVQKFNFDGSALASGVYVYRVSVDGTAVSKKMVLMK